ncbi:unnamed protein product [Euphydryas editha]|uniref:Ribbon-helix-helix protein CopG domain-containing protein n=1 Tax=Euphydryas editha TaxID=104508 RepID=A0AAU9U2W9_EUPED|nr:unnamed protein product [Euphydryas editha]
MVRETLYGKKPKQGRKHIKQPMQVINLSIPDDILEKLKTDRKNKGKEIVEISKKIRHEIREHKKKKMTKTFKYHIERTGGIKKRAKKTERKNYLGTKHFK